MVFSPTPTDDQLHKAFEASQKYLTNKDAAASLGLSVFGYKYRLKLYNERILGKPVTAAPQGGVPQESSIDTIERHRLSGEIQRLKTMCVNLTSRLAIAEDHRASILGLPVIPPEPIIRPITTKSEKHRQAVVLHLSDLHVGEVVQRSEVMGVNEYNLEISQNRIARLFNATSILLTSAWPASDPAPERVYVLLGGDLISGHGLHPDHERTDSVTAYQQVKLCAEAIASGINHLHESLIKRFKKTVEIVIISVVGNHGRDTFGKPRTKLVSLQSYDTLVSDFVEAQLKHIKTITHYRPRGFDAYFDAVGWPILLTHGDRMGSGGGTGFIGPSAVIVKGHRKILDTEHRQRRPVYKVFSGHFHTTCVTPFGFGNGSGIGYGEFAKSIRADPEPAQQNLAVFHERIGLLRWHPIAMGDPSEGSIYEPTAGLIMPNYRD